MAACDLVGVAGGRRTAALYELEFGTTILGSARDETLRLEAFGGDPDRTAFGVRGVIGVNGLIGVIGVMGVTGVIGGMFPSERNKMKEHYNKKKHKEHLATRTCYSLGKDNMFLTIQTVLIQMGKYINITL